MLINEETLYAMVNTSGMTSEKKFVVLKFSSTLLAEEHYSPLVD